MSIERTSNNAIITDSKIVAVAKDNEEKIDADLLASKPPSDYADSGYYNTKYSTYTSNMSARTWINKPSLTVDTSNNTVVLTGGTLIGVNKIGSSHTATSWVFSTDINFSNIDDATSIYDKYNLNEFHPVLAEGTYYAKIRHHIGNVCSPYSDVVTFIVDNNNNRYINKPVINGGDLKNPNKDTTISFEPLDTNLDLTNAVVNTQYTVNELSFNTPPDSNNNKLPNVASFPLVENKVNEVRIRFISGNVASNWIGLSLTPNSNSGIKHKYLRHKVSGVNGVKINDNMALVRVNKFMESDSTREGSWFILVDLRTGSTYSINEDVGIENRIRNMSMTRSGNEIFMFSVAGGMYNSPQPDDANYGYKVFSDPAKDTILLNSSTVTTITPPPHTTGTMIAAGTFGSGNIAVTTGSEIAVYDPVNDTWGPIRSTTYMLSAKKLISCGDDCLIAMTGENNQFPIMIYEEPNLATSDKIGATLHAGITNFSFVDLENGSVAIIGGWTSSISRYERYYHIYTPYTNIWQTLTTEISPVLDAEAFLTPDNEVLVVGGIRSVVNAPDTDNYYLSHTFKVKF